MTVTQVQANSKWNYCLPKYRRLFLSTILRKIWSKIKETTRGCFNKLQSIDDLKRISHKVFFLPPVVLHGIPQNYVYWSQMSQRNKRSGLPRYSIKNWHCMKYWPGIIINPILILSILDITKVSSETRIICKWNIN